MEEEEEDRKIRASLETMEGLRPRKARDRALDDKRRRSARVVLSRFGPPDAPFVTAIRTVYNNIFQRVHFIMSFRGIR